MLIIGCDYHPSFQQIAFVETETGELCEQRLVHREEASASALSRCLRASLPLLYVQLLAHDDHQSLSFLFRLRQPRNNGSKLIEYLVPALELTAIFRALHGFISNEGEFRPAVS